MERLQADWTHDCQGKQDYDAPLVELSTRYWPRGGGFLIVHNSSEGVTLEDNDARPGIRPSANASIYIQEERVVSKDFEGDTEGDVKAQVERWAQTQFALISGAVKGLYGW